MNTARLTNLAIQMNLSPSMAVALPAAVQNGAQKVGVTEEEFITKMERVPELRSYVRGALAKVVEALEK